MHMRGPTGSLPPREGVPALLLTINTALNVGTRAVALVRPVVLTSHGAVSNCGVRPGEWKQKLFAVLPRARSFHSSSCGPTPHRPGSRRGTRLRAQLSPSVRPQTQCSDKEHLLFAFIDANTIARVS